MNTSYSLAKTRPNANVLRFTLPGFETSIDVPFPGRELPVCERCKKNFKTREHCRVHKAHTSLPWSKTFLCITLDRTCTNKDNKLIPGPFATTILPTQSMCLQNDIDLSTPICSMCKERNYTRTYCRQNKKHRQLPWNTVYILLSYDPNCALSLPYGDIVRKSGYKRRKTGNEQPNEKKVAEASGTTTDDNDATQSSKVNVIDSETSVVGDHCKDAETYQFNNIPRSRTFLAIVSSQATAIEWLDLDPTQVSSWPNGLPAPPHVMRGIEPNYVGPSTEMPHYLPHPVPLPPFGYSRMYQNTPQMFSRPGENGSILGDRPTDPTGHRNHEGYVNNGLSSENPDETTGTIVPFEPNSFPYRPNFAHPFTNIDAQHQRSMALRGQLSDMNPMGHTFFHGSSLDEQTRAQWMNGAFNDGAFGMQYNPMNQMAPFYPGGPHMFGYGATLPPFAPYNWQGHVGPTIDGYPQYASYPAGSPSGTTYSGWDQKDPRRDGDDGQQQQK